jgi:hypothetical protein
MLLFVFIIDIQESTGNNRIELPGLLLIIRSDIVPLFSNNRLPDTLFSIFTSKYKELYASSLFVLLSCYRQEIAIRKTDLASMLSDSLEEQLLHITDEEEGLHGGTLSERAYAIIRRLISTGWLETEQSMDSFEEYLIVPDFAIRIIKTLQEISTERPKEYNSFVHNTYVSLKNADAERDEYTYEALLAAYRNTEELIDSLRSLLGNIRRYYQELQQQSEIRGLLSQHFDEYTNFVVEKVYHRIKTTDCVPRFRVSILHILKKWLGDYQLLEIIGGQMLQRGHETSLTEAQRKISSMLDDMIQAYENIGSILKEIDRKNSAYIKASVDRFQYLLNANEGVKGRLVDLLHKAADHADPEYAWTVLAEELPLHSVGHISQDSLYNEPRRRERHQPTPLNLETVALDSEIESEYAGLKERMRHGLTRQRVVAFIEEAMASRGEVASTSLPLETDEKFLQLIMSVLMSDEAGIPYQVEWTDGYAHVNGYRIPELLFTKKKGGKSGGVV